MGNANLLQVGFRQPWPVDEKFKLRIIRYCYTDKAARDALECSSMRPALEVWSNALGSWMNPDSAHNLAVKEIVNKGKQENWNPEFCFKDGTKEWNTALDGGTLAIHLVQGATPAASIGYTLSGKPGRHTMILPQTPSLYQVVHEFGHVLGMIHEQCRNDRDTYLEYRCENIKGYGAAAYNAMMAAEKAVESRLCEDKAFAEKYGFDGAQFTKNAGKSDIAGRLDEGPFDFGSIMMYPSNAFSNPDCKPDNIDKCPMVQIDKVNDKVTGTSWIHTGEVPSQGDIAFVKKWYPRVQGEGASAVVRRTEVRGNVREHIFHVPKAEERK